MSSLGRVFAMLRYPAVRRFVQKTSSAVQRIADELRAALMATRPPSVGPHDGTTLPRGSRGRRGSSIGLLDSVFGLLPNPGTLQQLTHEIRLPDNRSC